MSNMKINWNSAIRYGTGGLILGGYIGSSIFNHSIILTVVCSLIGAVIAAKTTNNLKQQGE
ncbi:hypothetical protein KTE91_03610 [Burkholderia multivorans]|uniref:hypothetical protein n=1 Tax=Burkholderia multivorans TaxID=87883 RepID=UPI001C217B7A|nr:hypothetical protein [Burkholderia multivorans]MBU9434170.1 hypothetical protein [Burkholderia multivorans]